MKNHYKLWLDFSGDPKWIRKITQ